MRSISISIRQDQYLELEKIGLGAFSPLNHFMNEIEFNSVITKMRLSSGEPFTLPVVFDVDKDFAKQARTASSVQLIYLGITVGELIPESVYTCDKKVTAKHIYGTDQRKHPGVERFYDSGDWFIGGKTTLLERVDHEFSKYELTPEESRRKFKELGWKKIVGFQTRNVPHRAHEYLQRISLEHVDGLFIQPLVGQKKVGDYTPEAVIKGYEALINGFYPKSSVVLGILSTSMRYAGPREAVFHAIIRRNYGCSHFIVGRDHAGVGNYYGKYDGHKLLSKFEGELGIQIMYLHGPFYCAVCDGIATEQTCPHVISQPSAISEISGTLMRSILNGGEKPDVKFIRPEILKALNDCNLFINN